MTKQMTYRAVLVVDFTGQKSNPYQKLISALLENGWLWLETSTLAIETADLSKIWIAFDLIPRQASSAGRLSALTFQLQGSEDLAKGNPYAASKNHPHATTDILQKRFPHPET